MDVDIAIVTIIIKMTNLSSGSEWDKLTHSQVHRRMAAAEAVWQKYTDKTGGGPRYRTQTPRMRPGAWTTSTSCPNQDPAPNAWQQCGGKLQPQIWMSHCGILVTVVYLPHVWRNMYQPWISVQRVLPVLWLTSSLQWKWKEVSWGLDAFLTWIFSFICWN